MNEWTETTRISAFAIQRDAHGYIWCLLISVSYRVTSIYRMSLKGKIIIPNSVCVSMAFVVQCTFMLFCTEVNVKTCGLFAYEL